MTRRHDPRRILLISLGGAGDGLMATPLLRPLRARWPEAVIDVLVMQGEVARAMFAGNPDVHECLLHDFMRASRAGSLAFCWRLRCRRYDLSVNVMPQNRLEYNVVAFLIGARRRLGFSFSIRCGGLEHWLLTDRVQEDTQAHLVQNNLNLLREGLGLDVSGEAALVLPRTDDARAAADHSWRASGLEGRVVLGLHAGSGTTKNLVLRRWPPAKWAELARQLAADPRCTMLLLGSPDEQPLRDEIRRLANLPLEQLRDAPAMPVLHSAEVIARLDALICTDTLLTHLAAATQTPCVVIMGPTPHTSVYPWRTPHRIVRLGLTCSPCYGYSRHGIRCTHPQPMACLAGITPPMVAAAVASLLHESPPRTP